MSMYVRVNARLRVCLSVDHRLNHGAVSCRLQWSRWACWPSAETRSDVVSSTEDFWR